MCTNNNLLFTLKYKRIFEKYEKLNNNSPREIMLQEHLVCDSFLSRDHTLTYQFQFCSNKTWIL